MNSDTLQRIGHDLARELIERDVELPLKTAGQSMGTTIRNGDSILVRHTAPHTLRPGDIVVWQTAAGFTAHRILYKEPCGALLRFTTKGDSLLIPDPPVSSDDIIGRIVEIRRSAGAVCLDSHHERCTALCQLWYGRFVATVGEIVRNKNRRTPSAVSRFMRKILLLPAITMGRMTRAVKQRQ